MQSISATAQLFHGLEETLNDKEFRAKRNEVVDKAFNHLFGHENSGLLQWRRNLQDFSLATEAIVPNALGELLKLPVILYTTVTDDGFNEYYLLIGTKEDSICRNCADKRVKELYLKLTDSRD